MTDVMKVVCVILISITIGATPGVLIMRNVLIESLEDDLRELALTRNTNWMYR